jgi:predicted RNase H-like HicB family nuclease
MGRKTKESNGTQIYQMQVVMEKDEDGLFVASCPALEGCYTQGKTYEEAMGNILDVIVMCLEELKDQRKAINLRYPEVIGIQNIEVTV